MSRSVSFSRRRAGSVLLVDDYDDARAVLREALEGAGHAVLEAANGQQALNILVSGEQRVAMIVLDLQMPVMDGWQFINLLRSYVGLSSIPVLVVTAHEGQPDEVTHKSIFGWLHAPYALERLLGLVDECINPTQVPAQDERGAVDGGQKSEQN
jgi:CheY-like chemotaxis protein